LGWQISVVFLLLVLGFVILMAQRALVHGGRDASMPHRASGRLDDGGLVDSWKDLKLRFKYPL
jgi:hypothetical protein